jgi:hypothetical protein
MLLQIAVGMLFFLRFRRLRIGKINVLVDAAPFLRNNSDRMHPIAVLIVYARRSAADAHIRAASCKVSAMSRSWLGQGGTGSPSVDLLEFAGNHDRFQHGLPSTDYSYFIS